MTQGQVQGETRDQAAEAEQLKALLAGDDAAFAALVEQHHAAMTRIALHYTRDRAVAEEVVQEAWLGVLRGLSHFEGRSSLRTWIFRILLNRARTIARREARSVPECQLGAELEPEGGPALPPERFKHPLAPGHWTNPLRRWEDTPEYHLLAAEQRAVLEWAILQLPPVQREVITLRDVEGFSAEEVCNILELSKVNQRVLLHRARTKVRAALEDYFADD